MSKTKTITEEIKGKNWKGAIEKATKEASKKVNVDGFRKGKAPKSIVIKKYGKSNIMLDAANLVIDNAYEKMLKDEKDALMELIARPDVTIKEIDEDKVIFEFTLTLRPDVKLGKYKDFDIKKEKAKVTKEEINKTIEDLRKQYSESIVKEGKIANGDTAVIDFEGFIDDKPFEGGKGENYSLTIGSKTFIPGFEEQLIGLKTDDEKDVKVTFPKDYQAKELQGKEAIFKVKIHEVKETVVPKLDKDFFEDLDMDGVDSKETLESEISEHLLMHKEEEVNNKYIDKLLEKAASETEIDIPDIMIKEELDRMMREYERNLQNQGLNLEFFYQITKTDEQALRDQMKPEAERRVKYRLMLEEIAKVEKIEVSDKQAKDEAKKMAEKNGVDIDEFINMLGGLEMVKYDMKMRKAMQIVTGEEIK